MNGRINSRFFRYSWLVVLLLLTACLGGRGDNANQPALSCSESCAAQGQCGTAEDGRAFVLGHTDSPHTQNHNLLFPVDTAVELRDSSHQTIQNPTGEQAGQEFTYIVIAEPAKSGWVANSCIAFPPAQ